LDSHREEDAVLMNKQPYWKRVASLAQMVFRLAKETDLDLLSPEAVVWAYRLFLDRDPETLLMVEDKLSRLHNTRELRYEFLFSDEFKQSNPVLSRPTLSGLEASMDIEEIQSEDDMQNLLLHIQKVWQYLGEVEPYWSVLSSERYKKANIEQTLDQFYQSGKSDVDRFFKTLERNKVSYTAYKSCLEFGCGLGRVTRWFSERFESVIGCDISRSHLQGAGKYLSEQAISNVTFYPINQVEDIKKLPKVDVVFSVIVLQHNPPPVIELILRQLIKVLNPGGVAYIQLPTYLEGYHFSLKEYLAIEGGQREIEMHYLPQWKVFEIIQQEGGKILEVSEDAWTGCRYKEVSNTFLIEKAESSGVA
jgi:2-polyprenyl-3-methyl-5-hydroxy-6-metoxy-1,4-benzoquinol methylase